MSHLTVRQVPEPVERKLRQMARETGTSLNKTAITVLRRGLGVEAEPRRKRDLSRFTGKWTPNYADEFERSLEVFERVDEEMWHK